MRTLGATNKTGIYALKRLPVTVLLCTSLASSVFLRQQGEFTKVTNQLTNAPGQSFGWLHLTDLHVGMTNQDWLWPAVKSALFEDLDKVHQLAGGVGSGDLFRRSGAKRQKI